MTRRIVDGYIVTESDTRVTARPITDADRYAFLKTLPHRKANRRGASAACGASALSDGLEGNSK